jgi:hypothetical protein
MSKTKTKTEQDLDFMVYDPTRQQLIYYKRGRMFGGVTGDIAEREFMRLLDKGNNIRLK